MAGRAGRAGKAGGAGGIIIAAGLLLIAITVVAQTPRGTSFNTTRGVALDGYDVVAYFTNGRAVKGSAANAHVWEGTTWHFASSAHRDEFRKWPEKYAPQFGGFCAYGVSRGYTVAVDPEAWSIVAGRLYLNYSKRVQRTWDQDRSTYIKRAEAHWPALAAKPIGQEE